MNLDDLTIGEAKQLAAMFGAGVPVSAECKAFEPQPHPYIGKYVIARCYAAGVHAGVVESVTEDRVILTQSRRLCSWKAADGIALSGVAQHGLKGQCKVDVVNPTIYLTDVCELIPTTDAARRTIDAA